MKFLSEKDDVITAVLSKPAKAAEQLQNKDNAVRIGDVPNGAARTKVKIRKVGFSGASGASSSTTASGDIYRTETTAGTQVFPGKLERAELDDFLATNIPAAFKNAVIEKKRTADGRSNGARSQIRICGKCALCNFRQIRINCT